MSHCEGAFELTPGLVIQGACGSGELHDEHPFDEADKICLGSPAEFIEADCGHVGPHDEHPLNQPPPATENA